MNFVRDIIIRRINRPLFITLMTAWIFNFFLYLIPILQPTKTHKKLRGIDWLKRIFTPFPVPFVRP